MPNTLALSLGAGGSPSPKGRPSRTTQDAVGSPVLRSRRRLSGKVAIIYLTSEGHTLLLGRPGRIDASLTFDTFLGLAKNQPCARLSSREQLLTLLKQGLNGAVERVSAQSAGNADATGSRSPGVIGR